MVEKTDSWGPIFRLQGEVDGLLARIAVLEIQNKMFKHALQDIAVSVVRQGSAASELQKIAMRALE